MAKKVLVFALVVFSLLGTISVVVAEAATRFEYQLPASCPVTGSYYESYGQYGGEANHTGVDLGCPKGTEVDASGSGWVVLTQDNWKGFQGYSVMIFHGVDPKSNFPFLTFYTHLSEVRTSVGEKVEKGQIIGLSGDAGTGPHLHWGAANKMPGEFVGYYEHSSEMNGRGWIDPRNPPETIVAVSPLSEDVSNSQKAVETASNSKGDTSFVSSIKLPFSLVGIRWDIIVVIAGAMILLVFVLRGIKRDTVVVVVERKLSHKPSFFKDAVKGAIPMTIVYAVIAWLLLPATKFSLSQKWFQNQYGLDLIMAGTTVCCVILWLVTRTREGEFYAVRNGSQTRIFRRSRRSIPLSVKLTVLLVTIPLLTLSVFWFWQGRPWAMDFYRDAVTLSEKSAKVVDAIDNLNKLGLEIDPGFFKEMAKAPLKFKEIISYVDTGAVLLGAISIILLITVFVGFKMALVVSVLAILLFGSSPQQIINALLPQRSSLVSLSQKIVPKGAIKLSCSFNAIEAGLGALTKISCDEHGYPVFSIRYWNGEYVDFHVDPEVLLAAEAASPENLKLILVSISTAHSESPEYQNDVCSGVGACGTWQFMPETFLAYAPSDSVLDDRFNRKIEAVAAARLLGDGANGNDGMKLYAKTGTEFINCFQGVGCPCWNMHSAQARYVWRLYKALLISAGIE